MAETQLIRPTELIEKTWKTFSSQPLGFIGVTFIPLLPITVLSLVWGLALGGSFALSMTATKTPNPAALFSSPLFLPGIFIIMLLSIVLSFWQIAATTIFTSTVANGKTMTVKAALSAGWAKKGAMFKTLLPGSLISFAGSMLFLIPGIIVNILFSAAMWVVVEENLVGRPALLKSKVYVWGRGWAVFLRILLMILLILGAALLMVLIQFIPVVGTIASFVFNLMVTPLIMIYMYHIFASLKATRPNPPTYTKSPWWVNVGIVVGTIAAVGGVILWVTSMAALMLINPADKIMKARQLQQQMTQPDTYTDAAELDVDTTSTPKMPTVATDESSMSYIFLNQLGTQLQSNTKPSVTNFAWRDKSNMSKNVSGYMIESSQLTPEMLSKGLEMATFTKESTETTTTGTTYFYQSMTLNIVCTIQNRLENEVTILSCADLK